MKIGTNHNRRQLMEDILVDALEQRTKPAYIIDINKYVWANYKKDLKASDDLFYNWIYMLRWAASRLHKKGILKYSRQGNKSLWALVR